jgi:hypothetical protein
MSEDVDLYLKYTNMFLADLWNEGNTELNISIEPRNVGSGVWFTATWKTANGEKRFVEAQRMRLLWERMIKRFLQDERVSRAVQAQSLSVGTIPSP